MTDAEIGLLHEIKGKIELLLDQGRIQDDRMTALDGRVRAVEVVAAPAVEYERRLRAVEGRVNRYAGAAALAGSIGGGVFAWIGSKISFHG
jgi:hypothetical protein